jgi:hypothetical protein
VGELRRKTFAAPDETLASRGITDQVVRLAGYAVTRSVQQPGWRYSRDVPEAAENGGWCVQHHVGVVVSGRWGAELRDGTTFEWGPDDVYDCPPGHDGFTVGAEPCVMIEWAAERET